MLHRSAPPHAIVGSLVLVLLALLTFSSSARADGKTEGAAKALEAKAMQEDYLATDFDKALEKLNQAAGKCGTEKCSSIVRAQIKRDIGVVQSGKQNHEAAVASFVEALKADSNVQLDPDTRTKDIDSAWAEAKKQAGSGGGGGAPAAGDFAMQPAAETLVRTPLPIYGEYGGNETLAKVVVKYKGFGMGEWKTLEMKELGKGWAVEIPCLDVTQGDFVYYVQGFNANNDPVATSGDRNNPYKTSVKPNYSGAALHLPGKDPPKQCADTGDCPPDFPGCKKPEGPATGKDEGETCEEDSECKSGTCGTDKTCKGGGSEGGEEGSKKFARFWVGASFQFDFLNIPTGNQVCLLYPAGNPLSAQPVNGAGYYCTNPADGSDYPSRTDGGTQNSTISPTGSDKVASGFAPGNLRLMASFDYALTKFLLVGLRFGYVFNSYPGQAAKTEGKAFAPIHFEARGTWVIGKDPLAKKGLAPYAMIAGGVSQWSANVGVTVVPNTNTVKNAPPGTSRAEQAWNMSGPGFVSLGGGLRYAFTPRFAGMLGPRFSLAFGNNGTLIAISPELSLQYGF